MADCKEIIFDRHQMKRLRLKAGMTQVEIANRIGVCPGAYYMWEKGKRTPNATSFLRLLCALGVEHTPFEMATFVEGDTDG